MNINIDGKDVELKFSFNSFKYMQDFDLKELADIEAKPFKIIGIVESLLIGAVNHDAKVKFSEQKVELFLEEYMVEGSITELLETLMKMLEDSYFFKSLQKTTQKAPMSVPKKK
jgi:hypothetical protein